MTNGMTKGLLAARVLALTIAAIGVSVGPGGVATATPAVTTLGTPERLADRQPAAWDDDSGDDSGDDDGDSDVS